MKNLKLLKQKEANKYFKRNFKLLYNTNNDSGILDLCKIINIKPKSILEIGCANGIRLHE